MKKRRLNLTMSTYTHERLEAMRKQYGFSSGCEMVTAFINLLLDRLEKPEFRTYDLPEDEGEYIDDMFSEMANSVSQPEGTVPVRSKHRRINER